MTRERGFTCEEKRHLVCLAGGAADEYRNGRQCVQPTLQSGESQGNICGGYLRASEKVPSLSLLLPTSSETQVVISCSALSCCCVANTESVSSLMTSKWSVVACVCRDKFHRCQKHTRGKIAIVFWAARVKTGTCLLLVGLSLLDKWEGGVANVQLRENCQCEQL